MNILFRIIILTALLALGYWFSQRLLLHSGLEKVGLELPAEVELDISRGYVIPDQKVLSYTLSQSPEKLWISSSALLQGSNSKTANYPYSLTVTVLNKDDEALYRNEFHHQSSATKIVELSINGQEVPESFLADQNQNLSAPQNVHFQLPQGATKLEITQQISSPQITDVVVRAYQFVQRSSRVAPIDLWQRLSQKTKQRLTENFPFEETFLSNDEKASLAEYRWQPLVPQGDEFDDYLSVLMYRINKQFIENKKHLLSQYEHHADVYKRISFPIEVPGLYRLEGQHEFQPRDLQVNMQWFNQKDSWMQERTFDFNETQFSQEIELKPGLVTFTASMPVSLNLFAITGLVEEHDHFSPSVMLLPGQELRYSIEHSAQDDADLQPQVTPMQVQIRAFAEQELSTGPNAQLNVSLRHGDNQMTVEALEVDYFPDEDSQLVNEEFYNWLGVAKKLYLQIRKPVDNLVITTNEPVLISVYTRLADMPAIRVLPEEKRDWYDYPSGVPDWFSVRPENWSELINLGGVRLLKHYHRSLLKEQEPPDPDETYQSLLTDFTRLELVDIMVENPFIGQASKIEENTSLNYAPVSIINAKTQGADQISSLIQPRTRERRWFYVKKDDKPKEIQWRKNGIPQDEFWIAGKWGLINQAVLFADANDHIDFSSRNVDWWQNNVPRQEARWQQRRAAFLQKADTITLENSKVEPEEMISIVVFSTSTDPVILSVDFDDIKHDPEVKDQFSITQRQYQIQTAEAYSGFQLSGDKRIIARQSFSILLGADILPGPHQMRIAHLQGDDVFISVVKRVIKPKPILERYRTVTEH